MRTADGLGVLVCLGCVAAVLAGCAMDPQQRALCDPMHRQLAMARMYHDYFDEAAANAVVRQATIFPYHFEPRTAHLTELGQRELAILATYLRAFPGEVRMPRGSADDPLYSARSGAVLTFLRELEVNSEAVRIVDGQPDGDGMAAERVVEALAAENKRENNQSERIGIPVIRQGRSNGSTSIPTNL